MTVCIDAGHGGKDSGAVGIRGQEKWIALDVAQKVARILRSAGVRVIMTRDGDQFVELADRAGTANQAGADLFVSIHCNSAGPDARGAEAWVYPGEADKQSAQCLLDRLTGACALHSRGVKEENFAVLRLTKCSAVLVELGFISNAAEEQRLMDGDFQEKASSALAQGILSCLNTSGELESVNDIVWELANQGIITDKGLWLDKLAADQDTYWLARKCANALRRKL